MAAGSLCLLLAQKACCQVKCLGQCLEHPRRSIIGAILGSLPSTFSLTGNCLQSIYRSSSQVTVECAGVRDTQTLSFPEETPTGQGSRYRRKQGRLSNLAPCQVAQDPACES